MSCSPAPPQGRREQGPLHLILLVAAGGALLTGFAAHALLGHWRFESLPLHATAEALPSMAAILTALLLRSLSSAPPAEEAPRANRDHSGCSGEG